MRNRYWVQLSQLPKYLKLSNDFLMSRFSQSVLTLGNLKQTYFRLQEELLLTLTIDIQGNWATIIVQLLRHVWFFVTPQTAACQASLSFIISQSLLKLMFIELVMPSNHLILCHVLLLPSIFPSIRVFSNESVLHIKWPKYWSFSISPSNEHSGLISFKMDWLDLLADQGTLKSLLQHHSSKESMLRRSAFFIVHLSHIHDHWKNHSFD